jgi:hypothetical protein
LLESKNILIFAHKLIYQALIMSYKLISVSFVGVLMQPMNIPTLNNDFCKNLFGVPSDTFCGLSPEGYIIVVNNRPVPMVVLNPVKYIFKAKNIDDLVQYVKAIKEVFSQMGITTQFRAYGMNYEYERTDLNTNADNWLWSHFIGNNISPTAEFHVCNNISLRLGINSTEQMNLTIEPRAGIRDGIFLSLNHHHEIPFSELPNIETLLQMHQQSQAYIEGQVLPQIIG